MKELTYNFSSALPQNNHSNLQTISFKVPAKTVYSTSCLVNPPVTKNERLSAPRWYFYRIGNTITSIVVFVLMWHSGKACPIAVIFFLKCSKIMSYFTYSLWGIQEPWVAEAFCLNICLLFCVSDVINLFVGKQVIHPNQIAVVQEQFSPSPEKIKWAEELIAAFKEHQQLGKVNVLLVPWMKLVFQMLWGTMKTIIVWMIFLKKLLFLWGEFVLGGTVFISEKFT